MSCTMYVIFKRSLQVHVHVHCTCECVCKISATLAYTMYMQSTTRARRAKASPCLSASACVKDKPRNEASYLLPTTSSTVSSSNSPKLAGNSVSSFSLNDSTCNVRQSPTCMCKMYMYTYNTCTHVHVHDQQTLRQLNKVRKINSTRPRKPFFQRKNGCLRWDSNPRHTTL